MYGAAVVLAGAAGAALGDSWTEAADAGQLPGQDQSVTGTGDLNQIFGEISHGGDVDMFRIYIADPSAFTATSIGGAAFDTHLALFDATGLGVIGDDDAFGTDQSALSQGSVFSPTSPGVYLLAITNSANTAASDTGDIFSFDAGATGDDGNIVAGPDGDGGQGAVSTWDTQPGPFLRTGAFGQYIIHLSGAQPINRAAPAVPLPTALGVGALGLGLIAARRRR